MNSSMARAVVAALVWSIFAAAVASAAESGDLVARGVAAYDASDYPAALAALEQVAAEPARYTQAQWATANRYLAMTLLAFERADEARDHFVSALIADPTISYDPAFTSPKILQTFNEAKAIYLKRYARPAPSPKPAAKPAPAEHTWRWPTGWALVGVGGASLAASGAFYGLMWNEHGKYEDEDESRDKLDQYERQGKSYQTLSAVTLSAGAVLTGVGLYFVLSERGATAEQAPKASFLLSPAGPGATPGLTAAWRF